MSIKLMTRVWDMPKEVIKRSLPHRQLRKQQYKCSSEQDAISRAGRLAASFIGVVAVSQKYDPKSGELGEAAIIAEHGQIPEGIIES